MSEDCLLRLKIDDRPTAAWLVESLPGAVSAIPGDRLLEQRWFGSKSQVVGGVTLYDHALFGADPLSALAIVVVELGDGSTETYYLPLAVREVEEAGEVVGDPNVFYLGLESPAGTYVLYDACADAEFNRQVFARIRTGGRFAGHKGDFVFAPTSALAEGGPFASVRRLRGEQSNTSVVYDDTYIRKTYRRLQNGENPDLEVPRFLTTEVGFAYTPAVAGYAEYKGAAFSAALDSLQAFVANSGDGWQYTLAHLQGLYQYAQQAAPQQAPQGSSRGAEDLVRNYSASYLAEIRRLGEITGQMHCALASDESDPAFAPEPVDREDLAAWVATMGAQLAAAVHLISTKEANYPPDVRAQLGIIRGQEPALRERIRGLMALAGAPNLRKIRHHGDYHLGQVLRTAEGFMVLDFEGEPARSLAERRAKSLALKDVAGMLRSFDYAVYAGLFMLGPEADRGPLETIGLVWEHLAADAYLDGYFAQTQAKAASFLPPTADLLEQCLTVFTLDKAIYEMLYEINNRPAWLRIPLQYVVSLVDHG
ncbi:MAG: maltokinase N-terminal cap-like domain-containing protein [Chloroflexota bacterium]